MSAQTENIVNLNDRVRGFVPPQNEEERLLMRRVEELCQVAQNRSMPRYTAFLSDREQDLARAAMSRAGCRFGRFWGGYPMAERRVLCLEPPNTWQEEPVSALKLTFSLQPGAEPPAHRDCLGALLGLGLERRCLGDLCFSQAEPATAYLFALEDKTDFLSQNFLSAGRVNLRAALCDVLPPEVTQEPERPLQSATVPSLRADTVLAAMMHTSRGNVSDLIAAGRVEVGHMPLKNAHEAVYSNDLFTVRGVGRFRLAAIGGKSRKDRIFISFFQY